MIKMGSLFAGIGGFERGAEMAFDEAGIPHQTLWQVEQDKFCQKVLKKHWPEAKIYNDVRDIKKDNVAPVDILMAGFPCQDISISGLKRGIYEGEKSSLWWEVWRITRDLQPRILVLENVANIIRLGGTDVIGSLAEIGYDAEWSIVSARERGSCHLRERWFCVAYPHSASFKRNRMPNGNEKKGQSLQVDLSTTKDRITNPESGSSSHRVALTKAKEDREAWLNSVKSRQQHSRDLRSTFWEGHPHPPPLCRVDDGISNRLDRLRALGNAIVPQCSQYVFECIIKSGLL